LEEEEKSIIEPHQSKYESLRMNLNEEFKCQSNVSQQNVSGKNPEEKSLYSLTDESSSLASSLCDDELLNRFSNYNDNKDPFMEVQPNVLPENE
jgi:hypothetical protein